MSQPLLFTPVSLREVTLKNRVVVAPMHQYSAVKGFATDWHLVNVGRYAAGGAGLVFMESTKVERRGCGTVGDLGLWHDDFVPGLKRCVDFIRAHGAVAGIQLGHSGRKARRSRPWEGGGPLLPSPAIDDWEAWELVAPSALAAPASDPLPRALERGEIAALIGNWAQAARRADQAGFDVLEIHGAHGYLLHEFLSPFSNQRADEYGGSELNRARLVVEIVEAIRQVWPQHKPLFLRLSCEDNVGFGPAQSVNVAKWVKPKGVDVIDCSSGGMTNSAVGEVGYGYQVPYAEKIKAEADIMTMAVGMIVHADQAEDILQHGHADLVALAREILYNPNWPMDAAQKLGLDREFGLVPPPQGWWLARRAAGRSITPSTWGRLKAE